VQAGGSSCSQAGEFLASWTKSLLCSLCSLPGSGALAVRGGGNKRWLLHLCRKAPGWKGEGSPGFGIGAEDSSSACFTWHFGNAGLPSLTCGLWPSYWWRHGERRSLVMPSLIAIYLRYLVAVICILVEFLARKSLFVVQARRNHLYCLPSQHTALLPAGCCLDVSWYLLGGGQSWWREGKEGDKVGAGAACRSPRSRVLVLAQWQAKGRSIQRGLAMSVAHPAVSLLLHEAALFAVVAALKERKKKSN